LEKGDVYLRKKDTPTLSADELRSFLRESIDTTYSVEIQVSGNTCFKAPHLAIPGTTTGSYSLKSIHEAALHEGAQPGPW
jgi:hypothetical protein